MVIGIDRTESRSIYDDSRWMILMINRRLMGWKRIVFAFFNLELIKIFLNPVNIKRILVKENSSLFIKMLTLAKYI